MSGPTDAGASRLIDVRSVTRVFHVGGEEVLTFCFARFGNHDYLLV